MVRNPLFLPELREMLAAHDDTQMREFCNAIHPARAAEFLEGLSATEIWELIAGSEIELQAEIFSYFELDKQVEILKAVPANELGNLVEALPSDDRVDLFKKLEPEIADPLLAVLPAEIRRDILRLKAFPAGSCGAEMSTDFVRLNESMSVDQAIRAIGRQTGVQETVYYLYVLDEWDHLVGLVSAKQLLASVGESDRLIKELMERDLITVNAMEESREAASDIAKYDFLAVPVVDDEHRMLGIITFDDVIDLNSEEATREAFQLAAVGPMEEAYLEAPFMTIWKKRFFWLSCLFVAELFTFSALARFEAVMAQYLVLALFVPLCISTGGNSGSQAATLITRSLALGDIKLADWLRVMRHELLMGLALGISLGLIGFLRAACTPESLLNGTDRWILALTIAQAVALICLVGTLIGSMLPLVFKRIGVDPAIASSPFVATFVDVSGIIIFFNIASFWLLPAAPAATPLVTLPAVSFEFSLVEPTAENRLYVQKICHKNLSTVPNVKFLYTSDTTLIGTQAGPNTDQPTETRAGHVACTMIFQDEPAYKRFIASELFSQFMKNSSELWHDRRVVLFEIETQNSD